METCVVSGWTAIRDGRAQQGKQSSTFMIHRPCSSRMNLTFNPPVLPTLAKRVGELPPSEGWIFEANWDGFRTLIFRDGDEVFIQSRDEKPLNRYFPELIDPLKAQLPER
jgi:ATP-dependent DNA ligase